MGFRIKVDKTDTLFSKLIRERDGRCKRCGKSKEHGIKLECSHYWSRGNKATRWSPMNCDTLCWYCHMSMEGNKQGEYRDIKLKELGTRKYNQLEKRARSVVKCGKYEKELVHSYILKNGLDGLEEYLTTVLK